MKNDKICIGNWNDCPEATKVTLCRKERNCKIEFNCMREWLKLNNKNN